MKQIDVYSENQDDDNKYRDLGDKIKKNHSLMKIYNYWWCDMRNFSDLVDYLIENNAADASNMIRSMYALYKAACISLHGGSMGNTHIIGEGFEGVDILPQTKGQEYALDLAVKSFIMVVTSIYKQIGLDYLDVDRQLNEIGVFYHIFSTGK